VKPVVSETVAEILTLPGRVVADPRGRAVITPKLDGVVRRLPVARGDAVEAGQVLVVLDSVPLARARAAYGRARRHLESVTAQRDAETALAEGRRETLKRYHDGVVTVLEAAEDRERRAAEKKLIPERKWLEARQALALARLERDEALDGTRTEDARRRLVREREVEEATRAFDAAIAALASLGEAAEAPEESEPGALVIRAAQDGTVVSVDCTLGEFVEAGEHLLTVQSGVRIVGSAFEGQLRWLRQGAPATVRFDALAVTRKATVESLGAGVDAGTRALDVWLRLTPSGEEVPDGETSWLRPGVLVSVELAVAPHPADVVVPKTAIVTEGSRHYVFVARGASDGEELFERISVTGRPVGGERFEVTTGLTADARVVVGGLFPLMSLARGEELEE
jgi:multidrug efflux pump subunit AcrA (membrane-fusion protein)